MPRVNVAVVVGSNRRQSSTASLRGHWPSWATGKAHSQVRADRRSADIQPGPGGPVCPQASPASRTRSRSADGVLFVTPEHNRSIPAVLKNAIDWGSRPYGKNAWTGKAAITGTSPGAIGTAVAQQHLRQVLGNLGLWSWAAKPMSPSSRASSTKTTQSRMKAPASSCNLLSISSRPSLPALPVMHQPRVHGPMNGREEAAMSIRPVKSIIQSKPTMEGAGVKLRRAFGFGDTSEFDPFLLLDDFRNDRPEDYQAGFPWHPHRGIETITYVLAGTVEHGDSLGNRGTLGAGDVQWMTAGSGILHQEMPKGDRAGPHARLPAVGQPALVAQDDRAALPGRAGRRDPRGHRRRRHARARRLRRVLGQARARSTASPPIRATSTSRCRRASARRCRSRPTRHAFAYVFAGSGTLRATRPSRSAC